ncbi:zwei Ig domain protein zig-8-like [Palaemon carinicauda]|uniref:zwei Ig domain protein zig-8-like n=1 Tax=Palaemon carinicauda TaxID=392227 RepID=UPI0035B5D6ED
MPLKQRDSHLLLLIWVVMAHWILSVDGGTEKEILDALDEAAAEGSWGYVPLSGPYIDVNHSGNVTAQVGSTAILNCRILYIVGKPVSWMRARDLHLLTVGRFTYTSDERFKAVHQAGSQDWLLKIHYLQNRDAGPYECQVSTTPPMSHTVWLSVVEPQTVVLGGPDLYINAGSAINLTCLVKHSPEPPPYIFWYHDEELLSYDSERGGVQVLTEHGVDTTSQLIIQKAKPPDSGQYTCLPATAPPFSLTVHIISSEEPAAIHHKNTTSSSAESGSGGFGRQVPLRVILLGFLTLLATSGGGQFEIVAAGVLLAEVCWRSLIDAWRGIAWWRWWWWWREWKDGGIRPQGYFGIPPAVR